MPHVYVEWRRDSDREREREQERDRKCYAKSLDWLHKCKES